MNFKIKILGITTLSLMSVVFVIGCTSSPEVGQRVALDSLSMGVGGAAGYFGSDHDPMLTAASSIGALALSEGLQAMARTGREKAKQLGIEEGIAIGQGRILEGLWEQSNGLPKNSPANSPYNVVVPPRFQNGVLYDSHWAPSVAPLPEKILSPATTTNSNPHYETFQKSH